MCSQPELIYKSLNLKHGTIYHTIIALSYICQSHLLVQVITRIEPTAEYRGVLEAEASSTPVTWDGYCQHYHYHQHHQPITTAIILISTFSKVSVPVQNWAAVVERWRRRRRRRGRRRCLLDCGTDQGPTWGGRGRGSRASSPLIMGPHLSHSEIKEFRMIQTANWYRSIPGLCKLSETGNQDRKAKWERRKCEEDPITRDCVRSFSITMQSIIKQQFHLSSCCIHF